MSRHIQADGRDIVVPDDATPEEINQIVGPAPAPAAAPAQPSLGQRFLNFGQEHPYAAAALSMTPGAGAAVPGFDQRGTGIVKTVGRDAYDVLSNTIPFARQLLDATGVSGKVQSATEPANEGERAGSYLTRAGEAAVPLPKGASMAKEALPSMERAGEGFKQVMARVGDQPVDVSKFAQPTLRAREFNANTGATYPPVLKKAMGFIEPTTEPMTFRQARDLESETGRRAAAASVLPQRMSRTMQAQLAGLKGGLNEATQEVAERGGVGDVYQKSLDEYRKAASIQGALDEARQILGSSLAKKLATTAGTGAAGYGLLKLFGGL